MMLSVVVLPHPDGPSTTSSSRSSTLRLRRSRTPVDPNRLLTPSRVTLVLASASPRSVGLLPFLLSTMCDLNPLAAVGRLAVLNRLLRPARARGRRENL